MGPGHSGVGSSKATGGAPAFPPLTTGSRGGLERQGAARAALPPAAGLCAHVLAQPRVPSEPLLSPYCPQHSTALCTLFPDPSTPRSVCRTHKSAQDTFPVIRGGRRGQVARSPGQHSLLPTLENASVANWPSRAAPLVPEWQVVPRGGRAWGRSLSRQV